MNLKNSILVVLIAIPQIHYLYQEVVLQVQTVMDHLCGYQLITRKGTEGVYAGRIGILLQLLLQLLHAEVQIDIGTRQFSIGLSQVKERGNL